MMEDPFECDYCLEDFDAAFSFNLRPYYLYCPSCGTRYYPEKDWKEYIE